ncbi:MAG: glycosyltransferase [Chitinivibrionales bacterium]|nr:glycosyltransferase [Chitinivibrionales bacterium]
MKIVMMTNTYAPFVGGVEKSIKGFSEEYRKHGHEVLIVAPVFENMPDHEENVVRLPAIQNFNGTDFSVQLPIPGILGKKLNDFGPDIIHSHHPYLVGDTALRAAAEYAIPIVFTFHTYYERYTHYVPGDSPALQRFAASLAIGYANLCSHIIAPSSSVRKDLAGRGVVTPISVIPTGINLNLFSNGNGNRFRAKEGIGADKKVIGFVSRLAPEKNIHFLGEAVAQYLEMDRDAHYIVAGSGPSRDELLEIFSRHKVGDRVHAPGTLKGQQLVDCYHAMDMFAFASQTETQGLVLAEAMACGVPVVALDGPGIRDVVENDRNGLVVHKKEIAVFVESLQNFFRHDSEKIHSMRQEALDTARRFTLPACARKAMQLYERLLAEKRYGKRIEGSVWDKSRRLIKAEWELMSNMAKSMQSAVKGSKSE